MDRCFFNKFKRYKLDFVKLAPNGKKQNIILILLTIGYGSNVAQPIRYNSSNVDSIIIKSIYAAEIIGGFEYREDVYTLYYDTGIDNFKIGSYIKQENSKGKYKKQSITEKYDFPYNAKEKIENLLFAIEQPYKIVDLSDFDINEHNIGSLIDTTISQYKKYYSQKKIKKEYIQESKNIDTFEQFLMEQYSRNMLDQHVRASDFGKFFSIHIKTSSKEYHIAGSGFYNSNQPYNMFSSDLEDTLYYRMINFGINHSLLEILPKDFLNIIDLTEIGLIKDYIEWYIARRGK